MTGFITDRPGERYEILNGTLAAADAERLLGLYRMHIGSPGCIWNEYYPSIEDVHEDIALHGVYCALDGEGRVAAAVSVTPDAELAALDCWDFREGDIRIVSRLAVRPDLTRRGIARALLRYAEAAVRADGCDGLFLFVAPENTGAAKLYADEGYAPRGYRELFELPWLCCEKPLSPAGGR